MSFKINKCKLDLVLIWPPCTGRNETYDDQSNRRLLIKRSVTC